MNTFNDLKSSYAMLIQSALILGASRDTLKHGNEILHHSCRQIVDGSAFDQQVKQQMKNELDQLKNLLDFEIEGHFTNHS